MDINEKISMFVKSVKLLKKDDIESIKRFVEHVRKYSFCDIRKDLHNYVKKNYETFNEITKLNGDIRTWEIALSRIIMKNV